MTPQTIISTSGERLIVISETDYLALVEAAEDATDSRTVDSFRRDLVSGKEELVPATIVDRILEGENRVRVWREHRAMTSKVLAEAAGIAQGFLSQIEAGKRTGTIATIRKLATALGVSTEDLIQPATKP